MATAPAPTPTAAPPARATAPPWPLGDGATPDPDLPLNARSCWDKTDTAGPFAASPTNPAPDGRGLKK